MRSGGAAGGTYLFGCQPTCRTLCQPTRASSSRPPVRGLQQEAVVSHLPQPPLRHLSPGVWEDVGLQQRRGITHIPAQFTPSHHAHTQHSTPYLRHSGGDELEVGLSPVQGVHLEAGVPNKDLGVPHLHWTTLDADALCSARLCQRVNEWPAKGTVPRGARGGAGWGGWVLRVGGMWVMARRRPLPWDFPRHM